MSQRSYARVALVASLIVLNVALFVPSFLGADGAEWQPFTPREHPHGAFGPDARSAWEYVKVLLVRRPNQDPWRVSLEFVGMVTLLAAAPRRRALAWVPWCLGVLYALLLLFSTYQHSYQRAFQTRPALWEDVALVVNLFHFLLDTCGVAVAWGAAIGVVVATLAVAGAVGLVFARVRRAESSRSLQRALLVCCGWAAMSVIWFGVERSDPAFQLTSRVIAANYRESIARRDTLHAITGAKPDRRNDVVLSARLKTKPRVHLLMIEAYGQRLATDSQMNGPFRELTSHFERRLGEKGLVARTAYSRAPIFGGRSWLSIGTVQTGIRIEQPSIYSVFERVSARITTLTEFFRAQGYRTLSLQPGNRERPSLHRFDVFRRDVVVDGPALGYRGQLFDWGQIPDQYSLSNYRENTLVRESGPYFSFYMAVSTHHNWVPIPFASDWRTLNEPTTVVDIPFPEMPVSTGIKEGKPRRYFEAVAYEWRALADFIEAEATDFAVFFIVGDHQPLIERTVDAQFDSDVAAVVGAQSLNTPVHVISRDRELVEAFAQYGFERGLYAEPYTGGLKHEGLFSLFVRELVRRHGDGSVEVPYLPDGVGLAGFSVE